MQTVIQSTIETQNHLASGLKSPVAYLLSELICNIGEHSRGQYGYIFSQKINNCLDICIADDGITIYGSYLRTKKFLDKIAGNEAEALKIANEGFSTKDLPEAENRGFGISSTKRMIVEGLGGSFFMLSGGAFHRYDMDGSVYVKLPDAVLWNGTIVLIRIPLVLPSGFNYLDYVI